MLPRRVGMHDVVPVALPKGRRSVAALNVICDCCGREIRMGIIQDKDGALGVMVPRDEPRSTDMARVPPEAAHPSGRIPGSPAPKRTDRSGSPNPQAAFRTSPGASVNKTSVSKERQAFRSRPGSGSTV